MEVDEPQLPHHQHKQLKRYDVGSSERNFYRITIANVTLKS